MMAWIIEIQWFNLHIGENYSSLAIQIMRIFFGMGTSRLYLEYFFFTAGGKFDINKKDHFLRFQRQ